MPLTNEQLTALGLAEDATPEQITEAKTKRDQALAIVEPLEKLDTAEALKGINQIENTISVLDGPDRPFLGAAATKGGPGTDGVGTDRHGQVHEFKSAGQAFTESEVFKAWLKMIAPNGRVPEKAEFTSPAVSVKALITSAVDVTASRPMLGLPDRRADVVRLGWDMLVLRDLVTVLPANSDAIETVREKSRTVNAAVVAEATATSGSSGVKPESALDWEVISIMVRTIAHWIPATTRVLQDARRLMGEIDTFLRQGLEQVLEGYMLTGNDSSTGFVGILNTTGILTQAYDAGVNPLFRTTRKARTKLKVDGKATPTAYLFHPNDNEAIDLTLDGENRYFFSDGPFAMGPGRLWGLPVIESVYQTEGVGLCGDFREAVLFDREETGISVFNQHADFAIRNLVAILAEMRAAFHVRRPRSFCTIDLTA